MLPEICLSHRIASRRALAAALVLPLLAPFAAWAWGGSGHRIVAQIGEDHLSPKAQKAVRKIAGPLSLAQLATWPDYIRSEDKWKFADPWHYVTVGDADTLDRVLDEAARTPGPDNVVEAIQYFADVLRDGAAARSFKELMDKKGVQPYRGSVELTALTFLVHFVGDIHQPLHVGRGDDRGGNMVSVNWFGEVKNLHSVWDGELIDHEGLSFTEFVRFLEEELAEDVRTDGRPDPVEWAQESIAVRHQVYTIWTRTDRANYLPELGYQYAHDHLPLVKRRLYLGGLRLAALLDAIF